METKANRVYAVPEALRDRIIGYVGKSTNCAGPSGAGDDVSDASGTMEQFDLSYHTDALEQYFASLDGVAGR